MSWWTELYDDTLAAWMRQRSPPGEEQRTVAFLRQVGVLMPGARVFDQGCGPGRLIPQLVAAGARVGGVDLMPGYIETARETAVTAGLEPADFAVGDITVATCPWPADLVLSWWTCLGYAPDDATNALPLARAFASLRPGGAYAIDTMNTPGVLRAFVPVSETVTPTPAGPIHLRRTSRLDVDRGVLHKAWAFGLPDGRTRTVNSEVRLYMPHTWRRMLESAGFVDIVAYGDLDGSPLSADSPRLILVARRPA